MDIHADDIIRCTALARPRDCPREHRLTVSAPSNSKAMPGTINGHGWTLKLAPGWRVVPAICNGDFTLRRKTSGVPRDK